MPRDGYEFQRVLGDQIVFPAKWLLKKKKKVDSCIVYINHFKKGGCSP